MSAPRYTAIVNHPYFERLSLTVIYVNAIWIAVDIEFNDADMVLKAAPIFLTAEILVLRCFKGLFK